MKPSKRLRRGLVRASVRRVVRGLDRTCHLRGNMFRLLRLIPDNTFESVVSDPPYALTANGGAGSGFMAKKWDAKIPPKEYWAEVMRVLKPGGYLLAMGGTRTYHRLTCAIEDAGFEIRDSLLCWTQGQGFPKSMNVGKSIDKMRRGCPQVTADPDSPNHGKWKRTPGPGRHTGGGGVSMWTESDAAASGGGLSGTHWDGWGTALKPAFEPIVLARKPLSEKTIVANVLRWGTGAINIDGTRVGINPGYLYNADRNGTTFHGDQGNRVRQSSAKKGSSVIESTKGRWPANVVLCHDEHCRKIGESEREVWACVPGCPVRLLDSQTGKVGGGFGINTGVSTLVYGKRAGLDRSVIGYGDAGGASRFFYTAKTGKRERNAGLPKGETNTHPTVKPLDLMRWMCRLVTPPGGLILDPFAGSGTTACAAVMEGFRCVTVDLVRKHVRIARYRVRHWEQEADRKGRRCPK